MAAVTCVFGLMSLAVAAILGLGTAADRNRTRQFWEVFSIFPFYVLARVLGSAALGVARPLTRTSKGAIIVGAAVGTLAMWLLVVPLLRLEGESVFGILHAAVALPGAGIGAIVAWRIRHVSGAYAAQHVAAGDGGRTILSE
ncbi:MAG: hypothetical protein ACR2F9_02430 [Longimicrobiaceae bacterium]